MVYSLPPDEFGDAQGSVSSVPPGEAAMTAASLPPTLPPARKKRPARPAKKAPRRPTPQPKKKGTARPAKKSAKGGAKKKGGARKAARPARKSKGGKKKR